MYPKLSLIALVVLVTALPAWAANFGVNVFSNGYSPTPLTVEVGDTVDWNGTSGIHTVTSFSCAVECLNSSNISPGSNYSYTFTKDGTFDYMCLFHPGMEGQVNVVVPIPEPSASLAILIALPLLRRRRN